MKNYPEITKSTSAGLRELRKDVPDALTGFSQLTREAMKDGVLAAMPASAIMPRRS